MADRFIEALIKDINNVNLTSDGWEIKTLFIGGGTPSLLSPFQVEAVLKALEEQFDLSNLSELTIEANPGEAPFEKLHDFRTLGINRISIGVQSFNEKELHFLGRIHSVEDIGHTVKAVKKAGFENFSMDLIHGIPGQKFNSWHSNLKKAVGLEPTHLSAYNLTVEEKTPLNTLVETGKVAMNDDRLQAEMITYTEEFLSSQGYNQYEISNFSKPGHECVHNIQYWKGYPYISFGPSAHSFNGRKRWKNRSSLDYYVSSIENGRSPVDFSEDLTDTDLFNEIIGFGIRLNEGIDLNRLDTRHRVLLKNNLVKISEKWKDHLIPGNNILKLSQRGRLFADAIAVDLMI